MEQLTIIPLEKLCQICQQLKSLEDFPKQTKGKLGRAFACIPCHREYMRKYQKDTYTVEKGRHKNLKQHYSITSEEYDTMFIKQCGVCAACSRPETAIDSRTKQVKNLHIDHDHTTGKVRALLCQECNLAFGYMKEDPERIRLLMEYAKLWI